VAFTQDFFTSRRNKGDGETYVHQLDRLWYDSNTNTIRIGDGTPGGIIVSSATGGGIETDPIFIASPAFGITAGDIINWDAAETDPVFTASDAFGIAAGDITNWNTAYGWGDHSLAGYALTADINLEGGIANQVLVKQSGTNNDYVWEDLITYEPVYTKLIDDASVSLTTYLGEALPNGLEANAVWRIKEIIFDANLEVDSVRYAAGGLFDQIWDDRLGLTYT